MVTVAMRRATLPVLLLLATACSSNGGTPPGGGGPPPCTFANPITSGADPWVVKHGEWYYSVRSRNNGIWVYRSHALTASVTQSAVKVWTPPTTGWNRENIWAPELHRIGGKWYIYYAAGPVGTAPATFVNQRAFVLESTTEDPQGTYVDKGMLYTGDDLAGSDTVWAIDMTVGEIGGQLYAVWSGWEANSTTTDKVTQHLYIARMADPMTLATGRVKISSPVESWEDGTELDLQEGPSFLQRDGATFIIYSTRESWLPAYRLGQLRLTTGADPLVAASWVKSGPVFEGTGNVYGVGHASFTVSPDGSEHWIVYHSKSLSTPGWDDRVVRMQSFGWKADGSPNFGTPVAPGQRIALPAGQCSP
jgi:GH43 family beta-xylosidase